MANLINETSRKECNMNIIQTWKRDPPTSVSGDSITVKIVYSSFKQEEIDELEKRMPKGIIVFCTDGQCESS